MRRSASNLKTSKLAQCRPHVEGDAPNVPFHPLGDRRQKSLQLHRGSLGYQLDPTIRQVPDKSADLESFCQATGRLPKADSLHMAAVVRRTSFSGRCALLSHGTKSFEGLDAARPGGGYNLVIAIVCDRRKRGLQPTF